MKYSTDRTIEREESESVQGARDVARVVEHSPDMHKALGSVPRMASLRHGAHSHPQCCVGSG